MIRLTQDAVLRLLYNPARVLTALLLATAIVACSSPTEETTPSASNFTWTQSSQNGIYTVRIEPQEKRIPIGEYHEWVVSLSDNSDQPVTAALIHINGGMPSHGHGLPSQPQISELAKGRYRIEGVRFNMGGSWVLKFRIQSSAGQDTAQFKIELAL
ncbi:MAG: FixH family protein [Gammaproteobacteria bacterium]